jgi:hypothetical protein
MDHTPEGHQPHGTVIVVWEVVELLDLKEMAELEDMMLQDQLEMVNLLVLILVPEAVVVVEDILMPIQMAVLEDLVISTYFGKNDICSNHTNNYRGYYLHQITLGCSKGPLRSN